MAIPESNPVYINVEKMDDVTSVSLKISRLTEEDNIEQFGRELFALVEKFDARKIALSLHDVEYFTSAVVGKMISLHRKLHRASGMLVICDIGPGAREILRTGRLLDYFHTADNIETALKKLG